MARDSWLKRLIWLRGSPAGGSGTSYEKTVGPAPILSISDAKAKPAKSLIVSMEPIQDLHGYDAPWPAGGGKNKCYDPASTLFPRENGCVVNAETRTAYAKVKPNTDYIFSLTGSNNRNVSFGLSEEPDVGVIAHQISNTPLGNGAYSLNSGEYTYIAFYYGSVDCTNIMIEEGSAKTDYAPYSNICPISGRTGLTAYRTGKNLLSPIFADYSVSKSSAYRCLNGVVPKGETARFTLSDKDTTVNLNGIYIGFVADDLRDVYGPTNFQWIIIDGTVQSNMSNVLNQSPTVYCENVFIYPKDEETFNKIFARYNVMVELGSTASTFEPYAGTTYPVSWQTEAGMVYGGTVDPVSGVLTVTMAQIASYNGEALPGKWISDRDVYAEGTSPTTGAQVVYELATPQTYQLTPQQVQMLKGANVLWSDADDLTLTYIGTQPAGLLGGGFGGGYNPPAEQDPEELTEPESAEADEPAEETPAEEGENNGE